jgi:osmotically-inducible protein OsmY
VLRALLRTFFRGLLILALVLSAGGVYYLYRTGRMEPLRAAVADAALLVKVQAALELDKDLRALAVELSVREGTVSVSGRASGDLRSKLLERIASVPGVAAIDDQALAEENAESAKSSSAGPNGFSR